MRVQRDRFIRFIACLLAATAYLAFGGQTHMSVAHGETVSVLICGDGQNRTIEMTFGGGETPEDTKPDCCGDCDLAKAGLPPGAHESKPPFRRERCKTSISCISLCLPGSPLWPGAPPQGPPVS